MYIYFQLEDRPFKIEHFISLYFYFRHKLFLHIEKDSALRASVVMSLLIISE